MEDTYRTHVQHSVDAWKTLVDQQVKLATSVTEQIAKMQVKGVEQAASAVEQFGRLAWDQVQRVQQMADTQKNLDAWKKLTEDQMLSAAAACDMLNDMRGDGIEQTRAVFDHFAQMSQASLAFASEMSDQWRKLSLESARRAVEMMSPKA
jgi:hypothetical protein